MRQRSGFHLNFSYHYFFWGHFWAECPPGRTFCFYEFLRGLWYKIAGLIHFLGTNQLARVRHSLWRTHSSPLVVTRHWGEYWVGISRRAASAVLYLIVAWNVLFRVFNGQLAPIGEGGMVVGPRRALVTIYTCQTTSIYLVPFVVPVYRRRSAYVLLIDGS